VPPGIEQSERELEGVEVTKRFDAVNDNETDEQYMERYVCAAHHLVVPSTRSLIRRVVYVVCVRVRVRVRSGFDRMIQMEEEAEMRRAEGELTGKKQETPVRLTKKEKAEAKLATAVDPAEAKKVRTKLKRYPFPPRRACRRVPCGVWRVSCVSSDGALRRVGRKERRKQEYEQHMEKVKRHHKEGGVKLDGSQMFAHGANVPPGTPPLHPLSDRLALTHDTRHATRNAELMHWFSDPEGLKSKRDAMLAKKCNKLQRMAELRKTREKRIDMPGDPSDAPSSLFTTTIITTTTVNVFTHWWVVGWWVGGKTATAEVEELLGMTRRQKRMASKIQSHLEDVFAEDLGADSTLGQLDININVHTFIASFSSLLSSLLFSIPSEPDVNALGGGRRW
jgi:hypothetical protein